MPFKIISTPVKGVKIINTKLFYDSRGSFYETYKKSEFMDNGILSEFQQQNISVSKKNVLRGLHYQLVPFSQGKLVSVLFGKIFDVAVDLRKNSPTFRKYVCVILSAEEGNMIWIPEGFAHGFLSMAENTRVSYLTTKEYSPEHERGIIWNDPDLAIEWPERNVILSAKDSHFPKLVDAEINFNSGGQK
jgi:dTDP-4-dehydrorhamnose 3,5-epimerase